jgi:hypothetical protein
VNSGDVKRKLVAMDQERAVLLVSKLCSSFLIPCFLFGTISGQIGECKKLACSGQLKSTNPMRKDVRRSAFFPILKIEDAKDQDPEIVVRLHFWPLALHANHMITWRDKQGSFERHSVLVEIERL